MQPIWIDSDAALAAFHANHLAGKAAALDTEFQQISTHYPVLALVQLAIHRGECALIDALAIHDWSPLAQWLADETAEKICFGARNDLPLLVRVCGGTAVTIPHNVFDVQLACGFCGKSAGLSLKAVLEELLGIVLDKSETRSDWLKRPLTEEQLHYAAEDVLYLPEAAEKLSVLLTETGKLDCFREEMQQLHETSEAYREMLPEDAWRRVRGEGRLAPMAAHARLRALATWRETVSRHRNIPRGWLLPDDVLLRIAEENPQTPQELAKIGKLTPRFLQHHAQQLLALLQNAKEDKALDNPSANRTGVSTTALKTLSHRLMGLVHKRAEQAKIDPILFASRKEVDAYCFQFLKGNNADAKFLHGWRKELLGDTLGEIFS